MENIPPLAQILEHVTHDELTQCVSVAGASGCGERRYPKQPCEGGARRRRPLGVEHGSHRTLGGDPIANTPADRHLVPR